MKTLIVDDEPIARQILREELDLLAGVSVVGEAADGREALQRIEELNPDLVLLDLEMPVMGGFDVIRNLRGPKPPVIIIVTAFDRHAIQAFEAGAIDYLLKPVSESRLRKAVDRARALRGNPREAAESVARLSGMDAHSPAGSKIVGRAGSDYFLLDPSEVVAFQADGELVWIIAAKQRFLAAQSLRAIEARLPQPAFQRVHRNAIVNTNHIRKMAVMSSRRWMLTLSNGQELVVSKRQVHNIRRLLNW